MKDLVFLTKGYFDETGNKTLKLAFLNQQTNPGPVLKWNNLSSPGNGWILSKSEYYIKSYDGRDIALYNGNLHIEWYVWGIDMAGKLKGSQRYFYLKDHLGSTRAIVNGNGTVLAGYDYDAWGYLLENRSFNSDSIKFKYTGKERDKESLYDYFGARYYDARIGRWGTTDPLMEKHFDFSPYNYVLDNPLIFIDPDGKQVFLGGESYQESKGLGQYIDINETQKTSQNRFDNKRQRESGLTTTDVGLLDPVEWVSGGAVTLSIRLSATVGMSITEKLVEQALKNVSKDVTKKLSSTTVTTVEYTLPKLVPQLEKQLAQYGEQSIFNALKSTEKILKKHNEKLPKLKYKSSVEKEIKTFEKQMETIKQFIKEKGL